MSVRDGANKSRKHLRNGKRSCVPEQWPTWMHHCGAGIQSERLRLVLRMCNWRVIGGPSGLRYMCPPQIKGQTIHGNPGDAGQSWTPGLTTGSRRLVLPWQIVWKWKHVVEHLLISHMMYSLKLDRWFLSPNLNMQERFHFSGALIDPDKLPPGSVYHVWIWSPCPFPLSFSRAVATTLPDRVSFVPVTGGPFWNFRSFRTPEMCDMFPQSDDSGSNLSDKSNQYEERCIVSSFYSDTRKYKYM